MRLFLARCCNFSKNSGVQKCGDIRRYFQPAKKGAKRGQASTHEFKYSSQFLISLLIFKLITALYLVILTALLIVNTFGFITIIEVIKSLFYNKL